jgi:hypothetical protein
MKKLICLLTYTPKNLYGKGEKMHLLSANHSKVLLTKLPPLWPPHEMKQLKRPNLFGFARERKIQEGKTLAKHHNTQKWANTKRGAMSKFPWQVPSNKWMIDKFPKKECG